MAGNKNHHFVPQFYLRNFGGERCIALYSLTLGRHVPKASIKGQCQRAHLYGREPDIERALSQLEGRAAHVIREIMATGEPPERASADEITLLVFILYQWRRTPATAAAMMAALTEVVRAAVPEELREEGKSLRVEHGMPAVASMHVLAEAAPMLFDLEAKVLVNKTDIEFIASDCPVVLFNQWCQHVAGMGSTGLACRGLQIFLPVSPAHVLLLYDPAVYSVGRDHAHSVDVKKTHDVVGINRLQLLFAEESLYYSGAPQTAKAIDQLPFRLRRTQTQALRVERAQEVGGSSELLHVYSAPPSIKLNISPIKIRPPYGRVPQQDRASMYRDEAMHADEIIHGPRHLRHGEQPPPGTTWQVVDD